METTQDAHRDDSLPHPSRTPVEVGAHKLFPPPVKPTAIGRQAILDRVLRSPVERAVILQAPAGSGKSTTLQQLMSAYNSAGWATGWLTFDDADNDPRRFEAHIHALMAVVARGAGKPARPATDQEGIQPTLAHWMLDALSRLERPVALFFDELQALRSNSTLRFFRAVLPRLPQQSRVFIGSRTLPDVGLATLRVNGVAIVLRAEDLRFSADEASEFFAKDVRSGIGAGEIGAIYQRTEGWPAGLQLFRLALASPQVRTSLEDIERHGPRELAEYLTDNVVALQAPRVQEFLLRTSLLRRLSGPLCDAVLGRTGSQPMLLELERSGLFLTALDSSTGWFKYHGLFAGCLGELLRRSTPDVVPEVHSRAARFHFAIQSYEEAVYHALEAHDPALAADALDAWSSRLVARGELVTVERWSDALPFEHVASRVSLATKTAWALIFLRRRAKLRPLIARLGEEKGHGDVGATTNPDIVLSMAALFEDDIPAAAAIADRPEVQAPSDGGFPAFELGAASNLLAYARIALGEFDDARRLLALARTHNARAGAAFSGGYTTAVDAIRLLLQGQLPEALHRLDTGALDLRGSPDASVALAAMAACHLWALYEANELDRVEHLARHHQEAIAASVAPDFIAVAQLSISRTFQARGLTVKAREALDALEQIGHESRWPRLVQLADWERVRHAIVIDGDVKRAASIAERISPTPPLPDGWVHICEAMEGPLLGRIRLAIHTGDHAVASQALASDTAKSSSRAYLRIKLSVLDALLLHRKGMYNAAHRQLRRAVRLAQPGGQVRVFLDEGDLVVEMLRAQHQGLPGQTDPAPAQADGQRAYVEHLLAAAGTGPIPITRPEAHESEPLSEREKEILRFLCQGIPNKEMATRLFVSENTIKFHLKNIYAKLDVRNRSQAIIAARERGLHP
jgi:LuxR family maltose regulon positive regulatory protein